MCEVKDLVVVSDLHLASDANGQGLFRADQKLEQFLLWCYHDAPGAVLVLNGDIFDFLFADSRPGLDLTKLAVETDAIVQRHEPVFKALSKVARSANHQVVIISGNHDPELAFPEVQAKIESALYDGRCRCIKWLVHGEALAVKVGAVRALIEHGDRLDPWNGIDHDKLNSAVSLATRGLIDQHEYQPPLGSRLVTDHLLRIRKRFPWAELLKPETEAVLPLLQYLGSFRDLVDHSGLIALYTSAESKSRTTKLRERLDPATKFRRESIFETSIGARIRAMADEMVSAKEGLKRSRLVRKLKSASKTSFFDVNLPEKSLDRDLRFLLGQSIDLLIHGHTHSAKAYAVGKGMYFNSGTWARLLKLPRDGDGNVWESFLGSIEANSYKAFERPTFVRLQVDPDGSTRATLNEWPVSDPLAVKRYTNDAVWVDEARSDSLSGFPSRPNGRRNV